MCHMCASRGHASLLSEMLLLGTQRTVVLSLPGNIFSLEFLTSVFLEDITFYTFFIFNLILELLKDMDWTLFIIVFLAPSILLGSQ